MDHIEPHRSCPYQLFVILLGPCLNHFLADIKLLKLKYSPFRFEPLLRHANAALKPNVLTAQVGWQP